MTAPATIVEAIDRNAKGPASVNVDGTQVSSKDISQLIEADRYVKAQTAAGLGAPFGLRFAQISPPRAG